MSFDLGDLKNIEKVFNSEIVQWWNRTPVIFFFFSIRKLFLGKLLVQRDYFGVGVTDDGNNGRGCFLIYGIIL